MGFQTVVNTFFRIWRSGEPYVKSPWITQSYILESALASYNIIGATAFSVVSDGIAQAGNPSGTAVFAGILVNPKASALLGTSSNPLAPSLTLSNYAQGELLREGIIFVTLPATAAIGDVVIYDEVTGALSTITPVTTLPTGKLFANANVSYFTVAAAGLAVITVNTTPVPPAP